MTACRILLTGIAADGRHGANPGERNVAQRFVVDLDVVAEVASDELEATADYGALADAARGVVERESFALLETLASAVAEAAFAFPNVVSAVAAVHKPGAAAAIGADDVVVEVDVR